MARAWHDPFVVVALRANYSAAYYMRCEPLLHNLRPSSQDPNIPSDRKRKTAAAPSKSAPAAKKPALHGAAQPQPRPAADAAHPDGARAAPDVELRFWEQTAGETGWAVADCLAHKLAFPKRADAKLKVAALGEHMQRLRAAGWTTLEANRRCAGHEVAAA